MRWKDKLKMNDGFLVLKGLLLGCLVLGAGCQSVSQKLNPNAVRGPGYEPMNVHQSTGTLPDSIRRVAFLPVVSSRTSHELKSGVDALQPILLNELARLGAFELVPVSEETLIRLTGLPKWTAEQALPRDFFEKLKAETGCEAVLFGNLTEYHPYRPIRIGWSLKLVEVEEAGIIWSVDESFDGADPRVSASVQRFFASGEGAQDSFSDQQSALYSPRRFGKYTAYAVFSTLPPRTNSPKELLQTADQNE